MCRDRTLIVVLLIKIRLLVSMKKLKPDQIYHSSDLDGLNLCYIQSNRKDLKQIQDKLTTCENVGMKVNAIFTDAENAIKCGYALIDIKTKKQVTEEEATRYYVILEGHTRYWAYQKALEKAESNSDYKPFDYKFIYDPIPEGKSFSTVYRQINQYNVPTNGADFARDLHATTKNEILEKYTSKTDFGLLEKSAGYATVGKPIELREIRKASETDGENLPEIFSDTSFSESAEPIYEKVKSTFCTDNKICPFVKNVPVWKWIARKLNTAVDKAAVSQKLIKMFDGMLAKDAKVLESATKQGNKSKEEVVMDTLEVIYNKLTD